MPAPSWPSTAGNRPSGSSPESVKASVWQTPVWVIFTSTSPLRGGSTSISTISRGLPGPNATAARDFIAISVSVRKGVDQSTMRPRGRPVFETGLTQIRTHQRNHFFDGFVGCAVRRREMGKLLAQMALQDPGHQPVDRAAHRRDLLKDRTAIRPFLEGALKRVDLPAHAAYARENALFLFGTMGHVRSWWDTAREYPSILGGSMLENPPFGHPHAPRLRTA
ncbi:hypothetical protein PSP6_440219 [Paraburkholderia tropica]|nr:hypothetical protein PSP6_440219 [Paraburkholderia tropica]